MNTTDLDKVKRSDINYKPQCLWQTSSADHHGPGQQGNSAILWFGESQPALLKERELDWIVVAWSHRSLADEKQFFSGCEHSVSRSAVGVSKGHLGCMDIALWNSHHRLNLIQLAWNKQMVGPGCPTHCSNTQSTKIQPFSSLVCFKNKHCSLPALSMWRAR